MKITIGQINKKSFIRFVLFIFLVGNFCLTLTPFIFPQSKSKENDRKKSFGKSLKNYGKKNKNSKNKPQTVGEAAEEEIRVEINLVANDILVINQKGNAVLGLKKEDFIVTEDGVRQEIDFFSFGNNQTTPRSIVLILDYSGNLPHYISNSIDAAKLLVEKLSPQDKMAIVTDGVKLVSDFTNDKSLLLSVLNGLKKKRFLSSDGGRGESYSALLAVLNEMFDEKTLRPIVIFQTSGGELFLLKPIEPIIGKYYKERDFSFNDIESAVEKSRAIVYSIIPGIQVIGVSAEEQERRIKEMLKITAKNVWNGKKYNENYIANYLEWQKKEIPATQAAAYKIAQLTGGYTEFLARPEDAETVYSSIFQVIENRYVIGYYPKNEARDGKRRNVKIEVKGRPEYIVMGRKSYFAPLENK